MKQLLLDKLKSNFLTLGTHKGLVVAKHTLTYEDLELASILQAEQFIQIGVNKGNLIGLHLGSTIEAFLTMLGLWRLGAVPVVFSPGLTSDQKLTIAKQLELFAIVEHKEIQDSPFVKERLIRPAPIYGKPSSEFEDTAVVADDSAAILFTSGSSSLPKGVLLSHQALGGNVLATQKMLKLSPDDSWFFNLPFGFTSAICHCLTGLSAGSTVFAADEFYFPEQLLEILNTLQITGIGGSPIQVRWLMGVLQSQIDLPTLRKIMSSGDVLPQTVWRTVLENLSNIQLYHTYGMTELGGRFCMLDPAQAKNRIGSVGKPIDGLTCTVRNPDTGEPVSSGQQGDVYAQGDYLMDEYCRLPEQTRLTLTNYGIKTGDIGWKDEEGYLFLTGRSDDVFKCSGEKVSTLTIAQALMEANCFKDLAVIGVPDEFLGMVPKVFFVPLENDPFDKDAVLKKLKTALPPSHLPHLFEELQEIPRTGSGKVIRSLLT